MHTSLLIVALLLSYSFSFGQTVHQNIHNLTPKEEYSNVKVLPLHSDENTSLFIIFVKQAVRKHVHQYHTEVVTVLEGTGKMYLGGDYFDIKKGDHIVIPPNTAHAVVTTSAKPLKVLSAQSPEFLGQDRIFIEEEATTNPEKTPSKEGNTKPSKKADDIPEFEGEYD